MNYYEFDNRFEYYALIGANNLEGAVKEYKENVGELEEDEHLPAEVSKEYALYKYTSACYSVGYEPNFEFDEDCILLLDESLL